MLLVGAATGDTFDRYDKNGDGRLSPKEVENEKLFSRMDANDNGLVTQREATLFAQGRKGQNADTSAVRPV